MSVWTEKNKQLEAEKVAEFQRAGNHLGQLVCSSVEHQLAAELAELMEGREIPAAGSDARGRLIYAFSCWMADELKLQLARLEEARSAPATEATQPESA